MNTKDNPKNKETTAVEVPLIDHVSEISESRDVDFSIKPIKSVKSNSVDIPDEE